MSTTAPSTATSSVCARSSRWSIPSSRRSKPYMALDIVTAITDPAAAAAAPSRAAPESKPQSNAAAPPYPVHRRLSPLTRRILFVNVLALGLLGFGFLYLGEYQDSLIAANLDSLRTQARIFAAALGEGAVVQRGRNEDLVSQSARDMMRRLVEPTETRARLFDNQGNLLGDTAVLSGPGGAVEGAVPVAEELPALSRAAGECDSRRFSGGAARP